MSRQDDFNEELCYSIRTVIQDAIANLSDETIQEIHEYAKQHNMDLTDAIDELLYLGEDDLQLIEYD